MNFTPGQRVQIVSMPDNGRHLIGQHGTVMQMGPFSEPGDVMLKTENGERIMVHDDQIVPLEE